MLYMGRGLKKGCVLDEEEQKGGISRVNELWCVVKKRIIRNARRQEGGRK
jgi:hypothetical protein